MKSFLILQCTCSATPAWMIYKIRISIIGIEVLSYFYGRMNAWKSNQEIMAALQNGREETLFYLVRKYFHGCRRWLRRKGVADSATPEIFSKVLVKIFRATQQKRVMATVEFEPFLFNSLNDYLKNTPGVYSKKKDNNKIANSDNDKLVAASCFSILDDNFKKLLNARYVSKLTYEEIAVQFEFGNPVIAQFEVEKAMAQFHKVAGARLNISLN